MFTADDLRQISEHGMSATVAAAQVRLLRNPPAAVVLARPCTIGDGIERIAPEAAEGLERSGSRAAEDGRVTKFVPASGAATRMFKELTAALEAGTPNSATQRFAEHLDDFPFGQELRDRALSREADSADGMNLLRTLLKEMDYASRPKGLIAFHRIGGEIRSAFEEHLLEACRLVADRDGICRVHFTVAPENAAAFESELARLRPEIEQRFGCSLAVGFSVQHRSTDTLATDHDGAPFRAADGTLLFRPGGHGSLLRNLGELGADIVSIKNIDNILPERRNDEAIRWKRVLIGLLVELQEQTFDVLRAAAKMDAPDTAIERAIHFAQSRFNRVPPSALRGTRAAHSFIKEALRRPIRVCGVVRNEGEPGGAPFWTRDAHGSDSIQIVESAQVKMGDENQRAIWNGSTHFNPVDVICGLRDSEGEPFDLEKFVDRDAVFVSTKSYEGRELHALELPGLWNGAMAGWNTVCVEVPASTFAPVKTVFDLLRPQHRGE